ncbi:AAA family ATPase [Bradyrhizobium sp. JYMT SZCCT0428]|uniref:AAA family ATPase n=1 Tax=Bradyrhizobium sp. JYMT SZCCT0428 TaxID=2807673 RepID=UPI001BA82361|nr:AAA family ATPase [Bradyrhizobium sp. JYMT SZCCT0428]MBR1156517.1 AAA family ATPase [Bradyrhizobium sp. JYMT SZCCT0428]
MNEAPQEYIDAAISSEAAVVANAHVSSRNHVLNRSAFKLGTIPGTQLDTVIRALFPAARANGYLAEHGEHATHKVIEGGFQSGQRKLRVAPRTNRAERRRMASESKRAVGSRPSPPVVSPLLDADLARSTFPSRTQPAFDGKPYFQLGGDEGPPKRRSEKRRHFYKEGDVPVHVKIMMRNGGAANWYRVVDLDGRTGWQAGKPNQFRAVPFFHNADPFDREVADDTIWWPEGERDVETLSNQLLLAVTFGGTGDGLPADCERYFANRDVVILSDNDDGGRSHAEKKATLIAPVAKRVRIVHFPDTPEKGDVSDWLGAGHTIADLVQRAESVVPRVCSPLPKAAPKTGLDVVCMADVRPTAIEYLWPNWIALGKVHVLAGEGGRGKTTLLHDWTARTTTGDRWPDGAEASSPGSVLILASEDDVGDTIAPRLIAAGADISRVFAIRSVRDVDQRRRGFNLQADLEMLGAELDTRRDVKLVIFDPITSYLGKVDSHNNSDVRAVLDPLGEFAARKGVAVICNNHFSKGGGNANSRIIGSVAFVNQARAAFIVTPDENDDTRMLLIPSKMNIAPMRSGLAYRIEGCLIEHEGVSIPTSRIMYEGAPISITADQALAALDNNAGSKPVEAEVEAFFRDVLSGGPTEVSEVEIMARAAGLLGENQRLAQNKAFQRARKVLGVASNREGFGRGARYVISQPNSPCAPQNPHAHPVSKQGAHDKSGCT